MAQMTAAVPSPPPLGAPLPRSGAAGLLSFVDKLRVEYGMSSTAFTLDIPFLSSPSLKHGSNFGMTLVFCFQCKLRGRDWKIHVSVQVETAVDCLGMREDKRVSWRMGLGVRVFEVFPRFVFMLFETVSCQSTGLPGCLPCT